MRVPIHSNNCVLCVFMGEWTFQNPCIIMAAHWPTEPALPERYSVVSCAIGETQHTYREAQNSLQLTQLASFDLSPSFGGKIEQLPCCVY